MKEIIEYLKARYFSEKAQGIMEYALIMAFVVVVATAIGSGSDLQTKVKGVFASLCGLFGANAPQ